MKRFSAFAAVFAVLIALAMPALGQDAPAELSPALDEHLESLVFVTEQIRQLETITPVERAFPTREETIDYLSRLYDEQLPQDELDRQQAFYVSLGMLEPETDLRDLYLTLLGSQVAGFYDTETKVMNVLPIGMSGENTLSFSEQIIFIHEYTHALQDQYFALDALTEPENAVENPDQTLAVLALIEGDASLTMNVYSQQVTLRNPMAALLLLAESLQAGNLTLPPGVPPTLVRELLFPYEAGLTFALALFEEGGWDAINAAYQPENLPQTSEQILHPEKYLSGEGAAPDLLTPYDITGILEGYDLLYDVPLGEFYLREHLRSGLMVGTANNAAAGWGADRFQLLENAAGEWAWMLNVAFDSDGEAAEFLTAYTALLDDQFGEANTENTCWSAESGAACLLSDPDSVTVFRAPTLEEAQALRDGA